MLPIDSMSVRLSKEMLGIATRPDMLFCTPAFLSEDMFQELHSKQNVH